MTAFVDRCPFTGVAAHLCDCSMCGPLPTTKPCDCGCRCRVIEPYDFKPRSWAHKGPSRGFKRLAAV